MEEGGPVATIISEFTRKIDYSLNNMQALNASNPDLRTIFLDFQESDSGLE